jgi:hypothetical protein
MSSQKRNLFILIALVGAWGLIFVLRSPWVSSEKTEVRETSAASPRKPAASGDTFPRLKRELLDIPPSAYPKEMQSIFGTPPPPPPPPLSAAAAAAAGAAGAPPTAPVAPPPDPFQEAAKQLRYVGYLEAGQRMMAVRTLGPEVYTVEVGTTISGQFRIQTITEDAVLLASPSGDKQARVPLVADAGVAPKR